MDKNNKDKSGVIIFLSLLLIFCVVFCVMFRHGYVKRNQNPEAETNENTVQTTGQAGSHYISPINFRSLREKNTDIYAWLEIPSLEISYPVLQNADDTKYLRKNINGKYDIKGSLFTESAYNGKDFDDPLTVIYGHSMPNGTMFGKLQKAYSTAEDIKKNQEVIIYLPEKELHYKVFAAAPYDNTHILYNYDFSDEKTYKLFFRDIMSAGASPDDESSVAPDDKVLILSTCLTNNKSKRFLVCAKLVCE